MNPLAVLMIAPVITIAASYPEQDRAFDLIEGFISAIQREPSHAKDFAVRGAGISFGDLSARSIDRFARDTHNCRLGSIAQPQIPANWKLDGARYFRVTWHCPPPYTEREGPNLAVDLFVTDKIVYGRAQYVD